MKKISDYHNKYDNPRFFLKYRLYPCHQQRAYHDRQCRVVYVAVNIRIEAPLKEIPQKARKQSKGDRNRHISKHQGRCSRH